GRARCGAAPRAARSRDLIAADVDSRPRNGYPSRPLPWERRGATLGSWLVAEGAFACPPAFPSRFPSRIGWTANVGSVIKWRRKKMRKHKKRKLLKRQRHKRR